MAAPTEAQFAHIALLESIDTNAIPKTFRNPNWKPTNRRNKTLKAILSDIQKKEAAVLAASQETSAAASEDGNLSSRATPQMTVASNGMAKMVLGKNAGSVPVATYINIEGAPSWEHSKKYCDVTGLPAPYVDPKTRMRYHNKEVFSLIRNLPQGVGEMYLEARGAHTVLK